MSKGFKIGLAICLLIALFLSSFSTDYVSEIFKDVKMSRIFLTIFLIGVPTIWFVLFRIEKKNLEKKNNEENNIE